MAAQLLGDRRAGLPLLPALADQLADQGTSVLAGFGQQVSEAVRCFQIQPHGERHGPQGLLPV
jgi:hypothetical protein